MTEIESILRGIGLIAVIAGTILVVLQVRVHAKNVRSRNAFDLITKVIDPSFARRRHLLYETAEKYADGDWGGFDRSLEDFEVRNFANIYEQLGLLAQRGVIDLRDLLDALSAQPMADWADLPTDPNPHHPRGSEGVSRLDGQPAWTRRRLLA